MPNNVYSPAQWELRNPQDNAVSQLATLSSFLYDLLPGAYDTPRLDPDLISPFKDVEANQLDYAKSAFTPPTTTTKKSKPTRAGSRGVRPAVRQEAIDEFMDAATIAPQRRNAISPALAETLSYF